MVIVCSQAIPKTDPYLVDRMTAIAALKGCNVLICINKCDLDPADALREYYENAGFRTVSVSAETGEGIEALRAQLVGRLSSRHQATPALASRCILNALDPNMSLKTGEVSQALGRGRHTTRHVELYELPCGAEIIDTPGFSSFETTGSIWSSRKLPECFLDFSPYLGDCQFVGCSHTKEKGCSVRQAVKDGRIVRGRHESYCRLYDELKDLREWNAGSQKRR
mgnify:CR=1 FL=1